MANTFSDQQAIDMIRGIFPKCRIIKLNGYTKGNKDYQKAKEAIEKGWNSPEYKQSTDEQLIEWMAQKGWIGLMIPLGHIVVDFDTSDAQAAVDMLDEMGVIRHTIKTPNGYQTIFKDTQSVADQSVKQLTKAGFLVDYRLANKGYIVLPSHQTDGRYWIKIEQDPIVAMLDLFDPIMRCKVQDRPKYIEIPLGEGSRNDTLFRHAGRLCGKGVTEDRVREIIHIINDYLTHPPLDEREMDQILRPAALKGAKSGQTWADFMSSLDLIGAPKDEIQAERKGPSFEATDVGNGIRLVHHYGDRLRYVDKQSRWYLWDGQRWIADDTREIEIMAKDTAETILHDAHGQSDDKVKETIKHYLRSRKMQSIRAMIEMAKSERAVAVTHEIFDKDLYKLNVLNGTIDLRSGKLQAHDRHDHITKIANVEYDPMAKCPTWIKFLERIMQDENGQVMQDLIEFLQRMIGYSLTGSTREQCFFILHGSGSNGKGTFFRALKHMLGDFADQADSSTFMIKNNQGVPNDIARLRGSRMVLTSESESNKRLAESLIKQLTGQDRIVARFLHQEFFEFDPQFKILFATNHKPRIQGNDHAIWRRIKLIPFKQTIGDDEKDPLIDDKLQAEAAGILNWAIEGCLKWQRDGLKEPEIVKMATQEYRAEMDFIQAFFDEHIQIDKQAKTSNKDLYAAYKNYANDAGEYAVKLRVFVEKIKEKIEIEDLPIRHVKDMYGLQWIGIKLIERDERDIFNERSKLHVIRQS